MPGEEKMQEKISKIIATAAPIIELHTKELVV